MNTEEILEKVYKLINAHKQGLLGGEKMPEDENPELDKLSKDNLMYFTLPMSLNYQRNSYVLWECANKMYQDVPEVFDSKAVCEMSEEIKSVTIGCMCWNNIRISNLSIEKISPLHRIRMLFRLV